MASTVQGGDASTLIERKMDEYLYVYDRRKDGNAERKIHIYDIPGLERLHSVIKEVVFVNFTPNIPHVLQKAFCFFYNYFFVGIANRNQFVLCISSMMNSNTKQSKMVRKYCIGLILAHVCE